jgi:hypothetical protein
MLGPLTIKIPAIRDPEAAARAIADHVAAIDAILGGLTWNCVQADDMAHEAGSDFTEALSGVNLAVRLENEWRGENGE